MQLGDAAGANKVSFEDSGSVEVAAIDSDGGFSVTALDATTFEILDSVDQSHGLSITAESNLTALRELQLTTGDANVALDLADDNADRLFGWDDTSGTWEPVTIGSGLTYDGTTLDVVATGQFSEIISSTPVTLSISASTNEGYGSIHYVDTAATVNLPAVVDGASFTIVTIGAIAVTVDIDGADQLRLDGSAFDTAGDGATNSSTAGDTIVFTYYSADGWHATSDGNWTAQ